MNKKDKRMRIMRGEVQIDVNPSATHEVQDGDVVTIISGVSIM
jgi:aspartate 1-decarboxylase